MVKLPLKITVSAFDIVERSVRRFIDTHVFSDDVSDDYKRGFLDFGNAVLAMLDKMAVSEAAKDGENDAAQS